MTNLLYLYPVIAIISVQIYNISVLLTSTVRVEVIRDPTVVHISYITRHHFLQMIISHSLKQDLFCVYTNRLLFSTSYVCAQNDYGSPQVLCVHKTVTVLRKFYVCTKGFLLSTSSMCAQRVSCSPQVLCVHKKFPILHKLSVCTKTSMFSTSSLYAQKHPCSLQLLKLSQIETIQFQIYRWYQTVFNINVGCFRVANFSTNDMKTALTHRSPEGSLYLSWICSCLHAELPLYWKWPHSIPCWPHSG